MSKGNNSKQSERLPIFGKPIFYLSSNNLSGAIGGSSTSPSSKIRLSIAHLKYFATEAILVKKVEYKDDEMDAFVINKDTDVEMLVNKEDIGKNVFFEKNDCDDVAIKLNEEMKE